MSRRLSAIRFAARLRNSPDPTANARVVAVWEGIRRTHGAPPEQAAPLMPPELFDVLACWPAARPPRCSGLGVGRASRTWPGCATAPCCWWASWPRCATASWPRCRVIGGGPARLRSLHRRRAGTGATRWRLQGWLAKNPPAAALHPHLGQLVEHGKINPQVRGWINSYGAFYRSELSSLARCIDEHLVRWAMQKFKTVIPKSTTPRSCRGATRPVPGPLWTC
jgi:hypothetical protein